jgi:hypothetical protein
MQEQVKHAVTGTIVLMILLAAGLAVVENFTPVDSTAPTRGAPNLLSSGCQSIRLDHRDPIRDALERLSEYKLKAFYVRCSGQSIERRLDGGEAMICSIAYEVLLRKYFGGDFEVLLAWSRAQAAASLH